jgi:hypothetical protein
VEAAALFGALNRLSPAVAEIPEAACRNAFIPIPARTAEERLCWQVACWVFAEQTRVWRGRVPAAVARLAAEFHQELRAHGQIRLPDPSTLEPVEAILGRAGGPLDPDAGGPRVDDAGSRSD